MESRIKVDFLDNQIKVLNEYLEKSDKQNFTLSENILKLNFPIMSSMFPERIGEIRSVLAESIDFKLKVEKIKSILMELKIQIED